MPDQEQRRYLFVAVDRTTRWVYVEILEDKSATAASDFRVRLIDKAPFTISKVLTDNGKEFTDRFCTTGEHQPTGAHAFDSIGSVPITASSTGSPNRELLQTNGMIECFNGRIADVLATTRFDYVQIYNQHIPQKALGLIPPLQAMRNWYQKQPNLFKKRIYNLAGLDSGMVAQPSGSNPHFFLPSLAPVDSGNPCRNDEVGASRLHHL